MAEMPTHRERKIVSAPLTGQGHKRECKLLIEITKERVNEERAPAIVSYTPVRVVDTDDFPPGNYDVVHAGKTFSLTKRAGHYVARQK